MILNYRLLRDCFAETYDEGRSKFLEACDNAGVRVDSRVNPHGLTPENKPLSCDVAWFGPDNATHLCMAICGTHGLEAASGSATMIQWILEKQYQQLPKDTAVLFVHANNPYGWAHNSRTNENNVDLNRNFFDHQGHPNNPHYMTQHSMLLTETMTDRDCAIIGEKLAAYEQQHGKVAGLASIVQGQYQQPEGLIFGGTEAEWSTINLRNIIETYVSPVKKVAVIDWHTGLGSFGEPFLICHHPKNSAAYTRACALWGTTPIEDGAAFQNPDIAPEFKGIIIRELSTLLESMGVEATGVIIEWGTYGNGAVYAGLMMDRWLRFTCDDPDSTDAIVVRTKMIERFNPSQPEWRMSVLNHAQVIYKQTLAGLEA